MRRLLFVDDDGPLLRALERMLRVYRQEWECHFESNPLRALEQLESLAPDALVVDMLMPGMDGAELLTRAAALRPVMARFILSGEIGTGGLVRMAKAAHQCLAKPCRGDVLIDVFRRSLATPSAGRPIDAALYSVAGLAIPGGAFAELRRLVRLPDDASRDAAIIALVERTAGIGTKVLQVATWTRLGLGAPPLNACDAYYQLGADALRALVDADLFTPEPAGPSSGFQVEVWRGAARAAADAEAKAVAAGMLGDDVRIATLAATWRASAPLLLDAACRGAYERVREAAAASGRPLAEHEREAFGVTAVEAFAQTLRLWGLAPELVALIAATAEPTTSGPPSLASIVASVADVSREAARAATSAYVGAAPVRTAGISPLAGMG